MDVLPRKSLSRGRLHMEGGKEAQGQGPNLPFRDPVNNTYVYTDDEKAETIAKHMEKQFQPNDLYDTTTEIMVNTCQTLLKL